MQADLAYGMVWILFEIISLLFPGIVQISYNYIKNQEVKEFSWSPDKEKQRILA